jgi:uncharacterized membrane protein
MNINDFLDLLKKKLRRFGTRNAEDAAAYYSEILDDKIADGMSEQEAVASLGDLDSIVRESASEMVAENKVKNPAAVVFLLIGAFAPVILPLAIVLFTLYIVVFVVWGSLVISFGISAVALIIGGIGSLFISNNAGVGMLTLGVSLVAASVLAALCWATVTYGLEFINLITVKLIKFLREKLNKSKEVTK